jgi:hypothetical protein
MFNQTDSKHGLCEGLRRSRRPCRSRLSLAAAFLAGVCLGASSAAQVPDSDSESEEAARPQTDWSDLIRRTIDEYTLFLEANPQKPLSLQKKPVLRWGNNTRATADAFTYLWIGDGRPEAVACIYSWGPDEIGHCFGSLSRGRLVAERNGQRVWHPEKPGVAFQAVPDAPAPAESPAARLRQMKMLARRFNAVLLGWDWAPATEPLRLLPRELYRYETESPDLLDGAVFAFVEGTDPETLLLLEAVRVSSGHQWQYAPARRTSGALELRYRDKVVWKVPMHVHAVDPSQPYIELRQKIDPDMIPPRP